MRRHPVIGLVGAFLLLCGVGGARVARACGTSTVMTDERGTVAHAVPLAPTHVRMGATRVVLVPFWDEAHSRPGLFARSRYTLVNPGGRTLLRVGVPERRSLVRTRTDGMGSAPTEDRTWESRSGLALVARVRGRVLKVHGHPGVGPNGWWHAFALDIPARGRVELETVSISRLGFRYFHHDAHGFPRRDPAILKGRAQGSGGQESTHSLRYTLGGRRAWGSPLGLVTIQLHDRGTLHLVRSLAGQPGPKDDLGLDLFRFEDEEQDLCARRHQCPPSQARRCQCQIVDPLALLRSSGHLASARMDTHPALAVDGDPSSQWVCPRGQALRSYLQIPSRADHDLVGLRITSGPGRAGCARPARIAVRCVTPRRRTLITTARLPDRPGPHALTFDKPVRCAAIHLTPEALHGTVGASVVLAEVEQRYRAGARLELRAEAAPRLTDPHPAGAARGRPVSADGAFDIASVDTVMWSKDGTLLHYRLRLENEGAPATGVLLGYIVEVGSGRLRHLYRLDRLGSPPAPYRDHWLQALPYEDGMALVQRYGFTPALASRAPPRGFAMPKRSLILRGRAPRGQGSYSITPTRLGFRWTFLQAWKGRPARVIPTTLELSAGASQRLARRSLAIDGPFARRHAAVWWARRRFFSALARLEPPEGKAPSPAEAAKLAERWHLRTYRHSQAYGGEVLTYWHPRGRAVAAFWIDRRDLSSRQPIPAPKDGDLSRWVPKCAFSEGHCTWERRDEPRRRLTVTVHALQPAGTPRAPARP